VNLGRCLALVGFHDAQAPGRPRLRE
jgi:hypothetical protein